MPRKPRQNYVRLHVKKVTTMTADEGFGTRYVPRDQALKLAHLALMQELKSVEQRRRDLTTAIQCVTDLLAANPAVSSPTPPHP